MTRASYEEAKAHYEALPEPLRSLMLTELERFEHSQLRNKTAGMVPNELTIEEAAAVAAGHNRHLGSKTPYPVAVCSYCGKVGPVDPIPYDDVILARYSYPEPELDSETKRLLAEADAQ